MFLSSMTNWFAGKHQHSSPRRRAALLRLDVLEARDVPATLSDGLLTVEGTRNDDTIRIGQGGSTIWVEPTPTTEA